MLMEEKKRFDLDHEIQVYKKKTVMVVDGTLSGEIRMGNRVVGSVWIPLPLYGIPTNMTEKVTLDAMCERCVEYDGRYTLKLAESQNLWIMEA